MPSASEPAPGVQRARLGGAVHWHFGQSQMPFFLLGAFFLLPGPPRTIHRAPLSVVLLCWGSVPPQKPDRSFTPVQNESPFCCGAEAGVAVLVRCFDAGTEWLWAPGFGAADLHVALSRTRLRCASN